MAKFDKTQAHKFSPGSGTPKKFTPPKLPQIKSTVTPPKKPMVVAMWLDNVLAFYDRNRGVNEIGRPIEGGQAMCEWIIHELGAKLIILTGRRRVDLVERWLVANGIPFTSINTTLGDDSIIDRSGQVIADLYIGPHCFTLEPGDFVPLVDALRQRKQEIAASGRESYDWGG